MKDARKRFDPELYAQNDEIARNFVKGLLKGTGYNAIDNVKKRGVDLLIYKDSEHICNIECEIKRVWKEKDFPYESIQVPVRKEKYALLEKPTIFLMMNNDQTAFLCIKSSDLLASPKKEVPNRYVYQGEYFFQVPKDKVSFDEVLTIIKEFENV